MPFKTIDFYKRNFKQLLVGIIGVIIFHYLKEWIETKFGYKCPDYLESDIAKLILILVFGTISILFFNYILKPMFEIFLIHIRLLIWFYFLFLWHYFRIKALRIFLSPDVLKSTSTISLSVNGNLEDYQKLLKDITISENITKLKWTNIYPVNILVKDEQGHRQKFSEKEAKEKIQICIINDSNLKSWQDLAHNGQELADFQINITDKGGKLFYILENDLKPFNDINIGDYAIFNDNLLLSFHNNYYDPKIGKLSKDIKGQLSIVIGNLNGYPNIFKPAQGNYRNFTRHEKLPEALAAANKVH